MSLEIEIKSKIHDLSEVTKRLLSLNPAFISEENHLDIYFNHPLKDFAKTDEALRIRSINDSAVITYKGPKLSTRSKARKEIETHISSALECTEIFKSLGFIEVAKIEKSRKIYQYENITICLDSVKGLGSYLELEKISDDISKSETELYAFGKQLGLTEYIQTSYLELILSKNEKKR